jgi:predicted outer membrane repeat protein
VLAIALAAGAALVPAGSAAAVVIPANCGNLQQTLTAADEGHEIVLDGVCNDQFNLPDFGPPGPGDSYRSWSLRGDPSNGLDGFDRNGIPGRALTGNDVHRLTIQNLEFRDGVQTGDGGAISLTGESAPSFFDTSFFNNMATGKGGAVYVENNETVLQPFGVHFLRNTFGSQSEGNRATVGGALSVDIVTGGESTLFESVFVNNVAGSTGGGFDFAVAQGAPGSVSLDANDVIGNTAGSSGGGGHVVNAAGLELTNELYEANGVGEIRCPSPTAAVGCSSRT